MTQPRSGDEYGVPFLGNAIAVGDPRTAMNFAQGNRGFDDVAQMTRVALRAWVVFPTQSGNGVVTSGVFGKSQMGTGNTNLPSVTRTGAGLYTITYPATWTDGAGTDATGVGQSEPIILLIATGDVLSVSVFGRVQCAALNQAISVAVISNVSGTDTLSDLTPGTLIYVQTRS